MPDANESANVQSPPAMPAFIAHYRIIQRLGKGGMGEVFLAEDTKQHGRKVALKILPPELTRDENRVKRFKQEARAVLALNHPNILTIFEIGQAGAVHYMATEYIQGETMRRRLSQTKIRIDEALGIAIQVAMALEAAHAAGIVHRDIKPENVMLREDRFVRDRIVKVLDFGLVKLIEPEARNTDPEAVTIPVSNTSPGAVLGTSGYMSPEQTLGEPVDARSDIFSLGVLLYEMVSGRPPFKGKTDSHVKVSIMDQEPAPLTSQSSEVPRQLERIVSKALAKDRTKRYQTATDLKLDLEQLREELRVAAAEVQQTAPQPVTHPGAGNQQPGFTPTEFQSVANTITMGTAPTVVNPPKAARLLTYRQALLLIGLAVAGGLAATLTPTPQVAVADESASALLRTGKQLFDTSCVTCHGANLQGVPDRGPSLIGVGEAAVYFQVSTGRMPAMRGEAQAPRKNPIFDESQIDALGAYVQANGGGPVVPRDDNGHVAQQSLLGSDVARGGDLFRLNCASCHNFTGKGGALSSGKYAPDLSDAEPAQIYTAMLTGPQNMPKFSDRQLSPEEKKDIVAYVREASETPNPGGYGLGGFGPAPEGMAMWIIGMVAIIGAALWIGSRA